MILETFHPDRAVAITETFARYSPQIASQIQEELPRIETVIKLFGNDMPLVIVGEANHVLLPTIMNGDNWDKSLMEILVFGHALTDNPDAAGSSCNRLSIFFGFADWRQDQRTRKPIPDSLGLAIVKKQGIFTRMVADMFKAAGVRDVTFFDMHSNRANLAFTRQGIETMNVTIMKLVADYLHNHEKLLTNNLETIIGTTDFGDLNRAVPLSQLTGLPIAVVNKSRIATEKGTDSDVHQKLLFGNPKGKRVIIVDDMISSGKTIEEAVALYEKFEAEEILIFVPHPVYIGDYYTRLTNVLKNPKVKLIATTNSIPLDTRFSGPVSQPYVGVKSSRRSVDTIDINPLQLFVAKTIVETQNLQEAKAVLGNHVWDMRDPIELAREITGMDLKAQEDQLIYVGEGVFRNLP